MAQVAIYSKGVAFKGALVTSDEGMLEGVSLRTVIEMAQSLGFEVQARALPADRLFALTAVVNSLPLTLGSRSPVQTGCPTHEIQDCRLLRSPGSLLRSHDVSGKLARPLQT